MKKSTFPLLVLFMSLMGLFLLGSCSKDSSTKPDPDVTLPGDDNNNPGNDTDDPGDEISKGGTMELQGGPGGAEAENTVFVNLSSDKQVSVKRDSWNLGFYNGDKFRVIINYTLAEAMAEKLDKNDLAAVTPEDTAGMILGQTYGQEDDLSKIDDPKGDLSKTVIEEIAANEEDNKVYIYKTSGIPDPNAAWDAPKPGKWLKIRILRREDGYLLQYAEIADANFKTMEIDKKDTHQFSFVSLIDEKQVDVQPPKGQWDFEYGKMAYFTGNMYYPFSDLVFLNYLDGVQAAEVLSEDISYDDYEEGDIAGTDFSGDRDVIGSRWRATTGEEVGVFTDRFYVIKDADGNVYKLKFIDFTEDDGGKRGYPNIAYKLVKKN